jgi:hypothetical protein
MRYLVVLKPHNPSFDRETTQSLAEQRRLWKLYRHGRITACVWIRSPCAWR